MLTGYLDTMIARQKGTAAAYKGQRYAVRRLSPRSNVSVLAQAPVIAAFPMIPSRVTSKNLLEDEIFTLLAYQGDCDYTQLQFGDVLSETKPGGDTLVYAQHRTTREAIFMRCESVMTVTRPVDASARAAAALTSPNVGPYIVPDEDADVEDSPTADGDVLTLANGVYAYQPAGATSAQIPVGIEPTNRTGQSRQDAQPTSSDASRFIAFAPVVPIMERDELQIGARRFLVLEATTRTIGLVGTIMILVNIGT